MASVTLVIARSASVESARELIVKGNFLTETPRGFMPSSLRRRAITETLSRTWTESAGIDILANAGVERHKAPSNETVRIFINEIKCDIK